MHGGHQGAMDCTQFEAMLSDALDRTLSGSVLAGFREHAASCVDCGPLLAQAETGMKWLKSLPELEPPRNLVHNILVATSGAAAAAPARQAAPWRHRVRGWMRPLAPVFSALQQPRFALSLGMAFFSVSVLLNAAGLHLSSLRAADLRPSAIQGNLARTYNEATARAVKYYENLRLVYEIESRVREIRNAAREEDQQQEPKQQPDKKERKYRDNNTSHDPGGAQPGSLQPPVRNPDRNRDRHTRQNEPVVVAGSSMDDRPASLSPERRDA